MVGFVYIYNARLGRGYIGEALMGREDFERKKEEKKSFEHLLTVAMFGCCSRLISTNDEP